MTDKEAEKSFVIGGKTFLCTKREAGDLLQITIDNMKLTFQEGKKVEISGELPHYPKQLNPSLPNDYLNEAEIYSFPHAPFHCWKWNNVLFSPVKHDTLDDQDTNSVLLVDDQLYGSYISKYNEKTIYHHGLIMNNHVIEENGVRHFSSVPPVMYDLAVILNQIKHGLHHILLY